MSVHEFEATSIDGESVRLSTYAGKVLLVVNVASRCGFTPQYTGLEALYRKYKDRGLVVLGFPCDQFGHQEPGNEDEIKAFCSTRYDVTFPMFAKIDVNGDRAHPLYRHMRSEQPGKANAIKWNFTKFLVDGRGEVVRRFESSDTPEAIEAHVAPLLS
jgi:glutathione peroxidase